MSEDVKESKVRGRPFPKGVSGNPRGRPRKKRSLSELLMMAGSKKGADGRTKKQAMVDHLWNLAVEKKDLAAIRTILLYVDGRPNEKEKPVDKRLAAEAQMELTPLFDLLGIEEAGK